MTGAEMREHRESLGMTQTDFGVKIGRSLATIHRYETDQVPIPATVALLVQMQTDAHAEQLNHKEA